MNCVYDRRTVSKSCLLGPTAFWLLLSKSPGYSWLNCSVLTSELSNKHKRSAHKPKGRWELDELILIHSLHLWDVFIHFHSLPLHHLSTAALFKFSRPWLQPRLSIKICVTLHFVLSSISLTSPDDRWLTYTDGVFFTNHAVTQWSYTSVFGNKWKTSAVLWPPFSSECLKKKKNKNTNPQIGQAEAED